MIQSVYMHLEDTACYTVGKVTLLSFYFETLHCAVSPFLRFITGAVIELLIYWITLLN